MSKTDEVLALIKNEVNDQNIRAIIAEIIKRLNERGKNATKHTIDYFDGSSGTTTMRLGCNRLNQWRMGGYYSSDKDYISDSIQMNVVSGLMADTVDVTTGDLSDAYEMLIRRIQKRENPSFEDIMEDIYLTTTEYYGGIEEVNPDDRADYYYRLGDANLTGRLSDLKGLNLAACVERAALSQNLLQLMGFESVYKVSQVTNNDKSTEVHAYNLVAHKGKYYLFDATIPRIDEKGKVTPIITEIPKEMYETLSHPFNGDDVSIITERDSVRGHKKVHYNSWSTRVHDTTGGKIPDSDDEQVL